MFRFSKDISTSLRKVHKRIGKKYIIDSLMRHWRIISCKNFQPACKEYLFTLTVLFIPVYICTWWQNSRTSLCNGVLRYFRYKNEPPKKKNTFLPFLPLPAHLASPIYDVHLRNLFTERPCDNLQSNPTPALLHSYSQAVLRTRSRDKKKVIFCHPCYPSTSLTQ